MYGKIVEITEDVYAYIQGRGEWFVNNTGLIAGDKFAIVIDTVANEKRAGEMVEKFREVTNKEFRILINTHGHPDHVWMNHLFDAVTIAHENARNETMTALVQLYQSLFPDLDFSGARITPQHVTFKRHMDVHAGMEIQISHPGVAHTRGDSYVYLPEQKVVFCGDLLFKRPCTPLALGGSIQGNIKALNDLLNLEAEVYVPGHGDLAVKEDLEVAKGYLEFVFEESKKRFEKGMQWLEAALDIDLGEYGNWREKERIVANVARAYAELEGREMKFDEILNAAQKMLQYGRGELE